MTELEKYVHDRCVDDGGCWVWQLTIRNSVPQMGRKDRKTVAVRRALWEGLKGPIPKGKLACVKCETHGCVNPEHLVLSDRKAVGRRAAARGAFSQPIRIAKMADTKRRQLSTLTSQDVAAIRASDDLLRVLAARFGVSKNTISNIRNGKRWKDYSNPFAGLFAMNDSTNRRAA
jgi:hypothetical protein